MGAQLFIRRSGGMIPTAVAERLREPLMRTMATLQIEIVQAVPFQPASSTRTFAVSLSDLGDLVFLPDLVAQTRGAAPGVSIRSVAAEPTDLLRGLSEGSIDVALGHLTDLDDANFFEQTLFEQPFVCLMRVDHPRIADRLSLAQFLDADHAVIVQPGRSQDVFERRVRNLGYVRRVVLQSPHFMSVPLLVARSDMIAVVPAAVGRICTRILPLKLLPVPFAIPSVELKQLWHRRSHTDPAHMWLRCQIATAFQGCDSTINPASVFWSDF